MKYHIVCLGDSNTHGCCADPKDCADGGGRFNEDERWTRLLQAGLGDDYLVLEEGLGGRTTVFDDPLTEGLSALDYVTPCMRSHAPVDLLIIMLGTNDTKERFSMNAACIGMGMGRLVTKAIQTGAWGKHGPNILVIAPPHIGEGMYTGQGTAGMGAGCVEKSRELAHYYRVYCGQKGVTHLDAQELGCEFNQIDYMHLTKKGHATLAEHLIDLVPQLIK